MDAATDELKQYALVDRDTNPSAQDICRLFQCRWRKNSMGKMMVNHCLSGYKQKLTSTVPNIESRMGELSCSGTKHKQTTIQMM